MKCNLVRHFHVVALAIFAAACATQATIARAELFVIDSSQSTVLLTISVGGYLEPGNPATYDPALGTLVGQATALPIGNVPGGVVPSFGDGSSAQLSGALDVNPTGLTFNTVGSITLLNSGLWQPNPAGDPHGLPTPAQAGGYLLTSFSDPDDTELFGALTDSTFSISTSGPLTVGSGGMFHDPMSTATQLTDHLAGYLTSPLFTGPLTYTQVNPIHRFPELNGTLIGNELTFDFSTFIDNNQQGTLGVPLIVRQAFSVHIVARPVPEPSTVTLGVVAITSLGSVARWRRRRS